MAVSADNAEKAGKAPAHGGGLRVKKGLLLNLAFVLALAILAGMGWQWYWEGLSFAEADRWQKHTYEVIWQLDRLRSNLRDAESGQRGFLITGKEDFLEPYRQGVDQVQKSMAVLRQMTQDNPRQQTRLDAIEPLVAARLAKLKENIQLRRNQGFEAASEAVKTQAGKSLMDQISQQLAESQAEEAQLLKERTQAKEARRRATLWTGAIEGILSYTLLITVLLLLKRTEKALRESEAQERMRAHDFEALLDAAPVAVWIAHDPQSLRVTGNRQAYDWLRLPEGANASKSAPAGERPETFMVCKEGVEIPTEELPVQRSAAGEIIRNYEFDLVYPDGSKKTVLGNAVPLSDESGRPRGSIAVFVDITERKRVEEALEESEKSFRTLAESVPQIVWATRPDGCNIYFNQRWVDYTGLTLEESYGHGWNIPFHPDDQKRSWEAWQKAVHHGEIYALEVRLRRADGVYRWWLIRGVPLNDATGKTIKWFGTCTDIHDLKSAEAEIRKLNAELEQRVQERTRELAESEERFRAIYDTAPVSIWLEDWTEICVAIEGLRKQGVTDFASHFNQHPDFVERALNAVKILDVNQLTPGMLAAKDKAEMLRSLGTIFAEANTRPEFVGALVALAEGQSIYRTEMKLTTMKGDIIQTMLALSFPQPGSAFRNVLMSLMDITDRVRAERSIKAALRNEVILKREIHHRVKNNLQIVISMLYLNSLEITDPRTREILRECQSRTRSIALIYALLSRSEDLTNIDFAQYAKQLTADLLMAYQVSPSRVALTLRIQEIFIDVDTALPCGLIITELVSNSLKYAFPNERKGEIEIAFHALDGGWLELTVRDNGIGFPEDFNLQAAQTMGAKLVHDLAKQLSGTLKLQGSPATAVTLVFPKNRSTVSCRVPADLAKLDSKLNLFPA